MNDLQQQIQEDIKSRTLEGTLEWNNSTLIRGNESAEKITELKRRPGKDIGVAGSLTLVESLLQDDLLDELTLMVHPVVAGGRLFKDGRAPKRQKLVDSKTTGTGISILTYRPAGRVAKGPVRGASSG
jgi:dihydrofolate reductase